MIFRSTGLGKTELTGHITDLERKGDYLILHVHVTHPVKWRVRAGISMQDGGTLLRSMGRRRILKFVFSPKQLFNKAPQHPGEF
jgi:hypothetical protein